MRSSFFFLVFLALGAAAVVEVACGGRVSHLDEADTSEADGADVADASYKCPDLLQNHPGRACSMPHGAECLGSISTGAWVRCCDGFWSEPSEGGSHPAPPCP